jgi:hypothetical protein
MRLPSVIVFDHMSHIPQPMGMKHPAFALIRRLIDKRRTWIELSVTYDNIRRTVHPLTRREQGRPNVFKPRQNGCLPILSECAGVHTTQSGSFKGHSSVGLTTRPRAAQAPASVVDVDAAVRHEYPPHKV